MNEKISPAKKVALQMQVAQLIYDSLPDEEKDIIDAATEFALDNLKRAAESSISNNDKKKREKKEIRREGSSRATIGDLIKMKEDERSKKNN